MPRQRASRPPPEAVNVDGGAPQGESPAHQRWTDVYFNRTREIVARFGDVVVTYAIFMRRPVVSAPRQAVEWLRAVAADRGTSFEIDLCVEESRWIGAGEPLMYVTGSYHHLVDLETLLLQKLGPACVAAYNVCAMCMELPHVRFLAMDARHCAGTEMADMMGYAACVGSERAKRKVGAAGFVGGSTDATAHYFGQSMGFGTMPHALIGYAGSTVAAAEMFVETFPDEDLTVLIDYFGHEITDALAVCQRFEELAKEQRLMLRLDTLGGRFCEGLDPAASYAVLERHVPAAIRGYRTDEELRYLLGPGVSAAAIWYLREQLDAAGFKGVGIVASSGFGPAKCKAMAIAEAPVAAIGTGSFLPERWSETFATADIVDYDGKPRVKLGREFLLKDK